VSSGRAREQLTGKPIPSPASFKRIAGSLRVDVDEIPEVAGLEPPTSQFPIDNPCPTGIDLIEQLGRDDHTLLVEESSAYNRGTEAIG